MNIIAVVVTYNRKKLLVECLDAILNQSQSVKKIMLIDNNSTDNTYEYLQQHNLLSNSKIMYKRLEKNIGGAGGFYEGIKASQNYNPDWVWIMDDDTIPTKECLKELINAQKNISEDVSYLASSVYGENGESMNVPNINLMPSSSGYSDWYKYLSKGIVKIREATFVSILINNKAIREVGYPVKDYFIWGDDIEYTLRLNKYYGNSYFVGKSVAIHKRVITKNLSLADETNINRLKFHYYMIRNNLINKRAYYGIKECFRFLIYKQIESLKILFNFNVKYKFKKFITIYKGIFTFLFKKYDYMAFRDRLNLDVQYRNENEE